MRLKVSPARSGRRPLFYGGTSLQKKGALHDFGFSTPNHVLSPESLPPTSLNARLLCTIEPAFYYIGSSDAISLCTLLNSIRCKIIPGEICFRVYVRKCQHLAVIHVHNHPSGDPCAPSQEDLEVGTRPPAVECERQHSGNCGSTVRVRAGDFISGASLLARLLFSFKEKGLL